MFKKKTIRPQNSISAGSMADIAFLLLIFFLVSTTVLSDQGITVKLPPWEEGTPPKPIPPQNVLTVKVNAANDLLVEGEPSTVKALRACAIEFISNPSARADLPTRPRNAIISLQNDRSTSYDTYVQVYNELKAAYNELWEKQSRQQFGQAFGDLSKSQRRAILTEIPLVISEAEPTDFSQ